MRAICPLSTRRFLIGSPAAAVLFLITGRAEAQGIGFQGGVTVDPEQAFVGTHFETGELFQNFRSGLASTAAFGGDFSLATLNIEFLYHIPIGRSWSVYQGGGPAVVFLRQNDQHEHARRLVLHVRLRARKRILHRLQARHRHGADAEIRCRIYGEEEGP